MLPAVAEPGMDASDIFGMAVTPEHVRERWIPRLPARSTEGCVGGGTGNDPA